LTRFLVSGMTAWQKCGFVFEGKEVFNPKVLYIRNAALPGGDESRLQTRRNVVNETVETIYKILEAATMEPEEKIFFIHSIAGRAVNSDVHDQGQRYVTKLKDQAATRDLTPLEQRIVDGAVDTGAMMDEDYTKEEEAMEKFEAGQLEGKHFKCSVCNKLYVREGACKAHGNAKHVPDDNFVCVALQPVVEEVVELEPLSGRNAQGRFVAASVPAAAAAAAAPNVVFVTPPSSPHAGALRVSPRHAAPAAAAAEPAPPRSPPKKKIRCQICQTYYWPHEIGKHNGSKPHKRAVAAAAEAAAAPQ